MANLTVADLIRVLQKLPADTVLWNYSVSNSYPMETHDFDENGPLFFQAAGHAYDDTTPTENRLCFIYDAGESGEPLDFSEVN
jgi:hypothetical protein